MRLFKFLKERWFVTFLGSLILGTLVWVAGPYVAFADYRPLDSEFNRLLAFLLIICIWGFNNVRRLISARNAGNQIIKGLFEAEATSAVGSSENEEVATLRKRFEEAMAVLKKSPRSKAVRNLYELPWYLMIGPPGSGKTTALTNSGLHFSLTEQFGDDALRGVGGTRNCDWFFTNEAILLDTAGRYTTQDSHAEHDRTAWLGFLDLLKKHRRRRPINGVMVAISIADVLSQSDTEREGHVKAIRNRIQELYTHFSIRFPIYFIFTKCDLIAGFTEFFDDLSHDERSQVWGVTFPYEQEGQVDDIAGLFKRQFGLLQERLNSRFIARLQQESESHRRVYIFRFLQQIAVYKYRLDSFLQDVFRPSRYQESAFLRGIYMTSATQHGTPIDRIMSGLARRFSLEHHLVGQKPMKGRSYFLTGLLKDVIFAEAPLVGVNRRFETELAWMQRASYAGALVVLGAGILAWSASYTANKQYVLSVIDRVDDYRKSSRSEDAQIEQVVRRLDELFVLVQSTRAHNDDIPLHMRFGMHTGSGVADTASEAYARELNTLLLPLVARFIEQQMKQEKNDPVVLYETLKTYLMLGYTEKLIPDQVRAWARAAWRPAPGPNLQRQNRVQLHLENLLALGIQPLALNEPLIREVRRYLRQRPLAEFVYGRLKRDYRTGARGEASIKLSDLAGYGGQRAFVGKDGGQLSVGIPDLFTYEKFYSEFQKQSDLLVTETKEEAWVLDLQGDSVGITEVSRLGDMVSELYLREYAKTWHEVLNAIQITPFYNVEHAVEIIRALSSEPSPIVSLLTQVEHNTALTRLPEGADQLVTKIKETGVKTFEKFTGLFNPADEQLNNKINTRLPGASVEDEFKELNQTVKQREGIPAPVTHVIALLSDFYAYLDSKRGGALLGENNANSGQDITRRIKQEGTQQPQPLGRWLEQIAENGRAVLIGDVRSEIDRLWTANVMPECDTIIGDRYPIDKKNRDEITLDDFGRLFGHDGILDSFFKKHLEPFVDKTESIWRWRSDTSATLGLSNEALAQLQRAHRIRETFFQDGGQKVSIVFGLKPIALDKSVYRFMLSIDGQEYSYQFGPVRVQNVRWPGSEGPQQVQVIFEDRTNVRHQYKEDGPWAWFRVLDHAQVDVLSPDRLKVTFTVDDRHAEYELRANSVLNPFMMNELQSFRCPRTLQ